MCFLNLQKVNGTVDGALQRKVLTRIGMPLQIIAVTRQLHDGIRACVEPDDGVCSDWFEVEQGLRKGCVLSPLLFNIFFTAVLTYALQRFSEDTVRRFSEDMVILTELVHLEEPSTSMGPVHSLDCVCRAVWGKLYANDVCIVSRSPLGLAKMMDFILEFCRAFAPTASVKKTELMCMLPPSARESKRSGKPANRCNPLRAWGAP